MGKATVAMQQKRHPLCGETWDHAKTQQQTPSHSELALLPQQHLFCLLHCQIILNAKTAKVGSICGYHWHEVEDTEIATIHHLSEHVHYLQISAVYLNIIKE